MKMPTVPSVTFKTRVRNDAIEGPNPFEWKDLTSDEVFKGKRVVLFALPGAFTPTCSTSHLPRFEELHDEFRAQGIDRIVCLAVNDAFVMYRWGESQNAKNVFLLPDGSGEFTRKMGMLVDKSNLGFGMRSWRYSVFLGQLPDRSLRGLRRRHHAGLPQGKPQSRLTSCRNRFCAIRRAGRTARSASIDGSTGRSRGSSMVACSGNLG